MRRTVVTALVGAALSLALISEAMAAPNADVDDKVKKGEEVEIVTTNCAHGEDYTAYIDVTITRADGTVERQESYPSDTFKPIERSTNFFPMRNMGSYKVRVVCRHEFGGGKSGILWDETEDLVVTGVDAAEKKKCKKKATRKARKRCLSKAAAD
jgi:hypothetical protein